jgi:Fe2+ transport system protein FeoA/DNA-binding PadR family transcriptional regulator
MELVACLLEVIGGLESRGEAPDLNRVSGELNGSPAQIEEALDIAAQEGFVERDGSVVRLTEKGRTEVLRHRERYVHDKYSHPLFSLGRITNRFGTGIKDWRLHWRQRHGIDDQSLDKFYEDVRNLQGRIENALPLVQLRQGGKGLVVFSLGGRGVVQRLAEMGLTPGTEVTLVREAPFHGPVEVLVRGVSLALGRGIASRIFVKPLE